VNLKNLTFYTFVGLLLTTISSAELNDIIDQCADCHGENGLSTASDVPILAGQSEILIEDALLAFSNNERPCKESKFRHGDINRALTNMCEIAEKLSENQMIELSKHFSAIKFKGVRQDFDASLVEKGAIIHERNCEKCHSEGGSYADDDAGILAGQWTPYLRTSIKKFLSKKRPMADKMSVKINRLKPEDFEALFSFYASKVHEK
jgi:sulfide dehydrogenase cytochrome subunit